MPIVKVKELIGVSPNGFQAALEEAVRQATEQKQNVTGAKIISQTATIKDGEVVEYKVNVKIAYLWEKELHNK